MGDVVEIALQHDASTIMAQYTVKVRSTQLRPVAMRAVRPTGMARPAPDSKLGGLKSEPIHG
jgi:hypothetical protein